MIAAPIIDSADQTVPLVGAGMLLALIFKSIMHLLSGWKTLADVERDGAASARAEADQARLEASAARQAAAAADERVSELLKVIEALEKEVNTWKARHQGMETRLKELERKSGRP